MSDAASGSAGSNANKQLIEALLRSRLFRDYESVFTKATGLPLALRPLEYWQLAHHGKIQENEFCAMLAEKPETLAVCLEAHDSMIRHTGDIPHTVTCPFGLTETAVPVKLGEKTIGYLRIGQVLRRSPSKADTEKVSRTLVEHGARFTSELRKAWEHNPLIPPERYGATFDCSPFCGAALLINQIVVGEVTPSRRLCRKRANTSTNTKWNRFPCPLSPRLPVQVCSTSARCFESPPA